MDSRAGTRTTRMGPPPPFISLLTKRHNRRPSEQMTVAGGECRGQCDFLRPAAIAPSAVSPPARAPATTRRRRSSGPAPLHLANRETPPFLRDGHCNAFGETLARDRHVCPPGVARLLVRPVLH